MRDLSVFADGSFDLVFNPVSNAFCPDLAAVWRECFRVLRPAGLLLLTHLVEAPHHADATAGYLPGYFATRAVKPRPARGPRAASARLAGTRPARRPRVPGRRPERP